MDEKKILEQLKASADDITPPESLSPQSIEKMLLNRTKNSDPAAESGKVTDMEKAKKNRISRRLRNYRGILGAAAALVITVAAYNQYQNLRPQPHIGLQNPALRELAETEQAENVTPQHTAEPSENGTSQSAIEPTENGTSQSAIESSENGTSQSAIEPSENNGTSQSTIEPSENGTSQFNAEPSADHSNPDSAADTSKAENSLAVSPADTSALEQIPAEESTGMQNGAEQSTASAGMQNGAEQSIASAQALASPSSYQEVYDALREKFYYEPNPDYWNGTDDLIEYEEVYEIAVEEDSSGVFYGNAGPDIVVKESASADMSIGTADSSFSGMGNADMDMGSADNDRSISMDAGAAQDQEMFTVAGDADSSRSAATEEESVEESAAADYSTTNIQEFGVDEADIVKTDGTYIYILRQNGTVTIVNADPKDLRVVSNISLGGTETIGNTPENHPDTASDTEHAASSPDAVLDTTSDPASDAASDTTLDSASNTTLDTVSSIAYAPAPPEDIHELYVDGDTLCIIATDTVSELRQTMQSIAGMEQEVYYTDTVTRTILYTYDITDREHPVFAGSAAQDGYYETSRKNGDHVYLFTSWYPTINNEFGNSDIIPYVNSDRIDVTEMYLPNQLTSSAYLLISSVDVHEPDQILDKKALISGSAIYYVSPENIYIANTDWSSDVTHTELVRFHYEDGIITGGAAGRIKGYLNDNFSLNEYNGYLRVVSTYYGKADESLPDSDEYFASNWEEKNALYILDQNLNVTGSIENLAPDETIRSARYFGNTGYFVTFRQTDPLFSVDLTDPTAPKILGKLKVSGFSSYLHFYGENLLLGLGYEADETNGMISGVKLSMFDISDPSDVKELHRIVIPEVRWCSSLNDYKSILIDPTKNLFGFFCDDRYFLFSYDPEQGFESRLIYDLKAEALLRQPQTPELSENVSNESTTPESQILSQDAPNEPSTPESQILSQDAPNESTTPESQILSQDAPNESTTPESQILTQNETESTTTGEYIVYEYEAYDPEGEIPVTLDEDMLIDNIFVEPMENETFMEEDVAFLVDEVFIDTEYDYNNIMTSWNSRGLYIGTTFYLAGDPSVLAFDLTNSCAKAGTLNLK